MSKRYRILIAISFVGILAGMTFLIRIPQEPLYEGKRLTVWMKGYDSEWGTPDWKKADEAVRHLGTNAIPTLLRLLHQEDSALKLRLIRLAQKQQFIKVKDVPADFWRREAMLGINALGAEAKEAVPVLVDLYEGRGSDRCAIAVALAGIGPEARKAVPSLLRALDDSDLNVRRTAAGALGRIHAEPGTVVPALIKCLSHPDTYFKQDLAYALEGFGADAKAAVPALLELLKHPDKNVRTDAVRTLKRIDPETAAEVEAK